jgi:hypothetical protein
MRKILIGLVAAAAIATPFVAATSANAATTDASGVVTVTKGDIQTAMGWNNAAWDAAIGASNGVENVGNLITTSQGNTPVDVPGGWLTLNGQIVANYPSDEYYKYTFTDRDTWCPISTVAKSYWTGGVDTAVTPILNAQKKVTGYKVSAAPTADGYVYWTRHTTFDCTDAPGQTWEGHATSRWPASIAGGGGVSDVKVNGEPVTVSPYVAPAV